MDVELGKQLGLIDESKFHFLWVTEFPLLERSEEEKVEAAAALYERAAMQWMQSGEPPEGVEIPESEEELEARSQELKLRQKCQDIAALMMVEELEDNEDM